MPGRILPRRRPAFTLIELIVVMAVIALLVALLLPAAQRARDAARTVQCRNNLKQIGLALHNYHDQHGVLPPSSTSFVEHGVWSDRPWRYSLHSWASLILPFLEQGNLHRRIDFSESALDPVNRDAAAQQIPVYICSSFAGSPYSDDPLYRKLSDRYALRNYVAMGATDIGRLWQDPNGAIHHRSSTRLADIKDGTTNTILIAETREQHVAVWIDGSTAALAARRYDASNPPSYGGPEIPLNYKPYYGAERDAQGNRIYESVDCQWGPSSMHSGGVYHLFGDGSVQFLSDSMDAQAYESLVSYNGGEPTGR